MAPLHVPAGNHQGNQVAGGDGRACCAAVAVQRTVDAGDGRHGRGDRAAAGAVRVFPAAHRPIDRRYGAEMSLRPRFSTLFALALMLVAALLVATAVLLDVSARPPGGKTVVTVRLWDEQVASAYRQSFAAFSRAHPDIEVQTHVVSYSTYFNTLRTDVAGGSADDIFWMSNAYLAEYADNGRLMDIGENPRASAAP